MNNPLNLYPHNLEIYRKVKLAFLDERVVGIVQATGTGKSYIALQLAYDNKDKKIMYVVPSTSIIEHIMKIINDNPNVNAKDFSHVEFRTYQSFINMSYKELEDLDVDLLITDEFHHLGAPVWGQRINKIVNTHPKMKVFGMTAYTVRDRGTEYERDMANPDTSELFSNKIVSTYDLCDAIIDGVLPKPIYKSAYLKLEETLKTLEEKINHDKTLSKEKIADYEALILDIKKQIHEAPSIETQIKKNIKRTGKYIYFCPALSERNTNDIDTIMEEAKNWFLAMGFKEDEIVFYKTTADIGDLGKQNRLAFSESKTLDGKDAHEKLKIMFAINQYNEGVHAPNIDGVFLGRGTKSDIVYFEQLGRALSVRGNSSYMYNYYNNLSIETLLLICKERDIKVLSNTPKEEIIEKLIAPVIFDLVDNYDYIKELENNLKDRIKQIQQSKNKLKRQIKIKDYNFDIEMLNQNIYEMLKYTLDRLSMTWDDYYLLAKEYFNKYGNLEIPSNYKTVNGYEYDENGIKLGLWISHQRGKKNLDQNKVMLLKQINMDFDLANYRYWKKLYELAKKYYEYYGVLDVPQSFVTIDGIHKVEKGTKGSYNLGRWLARIRLDKKDLPKEQIESLDAIGMVWKINETKWKVKFELAKKYYEHYGNLEIPASFITIDGINSVDSKTKGSYNLGQWISNLRANKSNLSEERINDLEKIGMVWNTYGQKWNIMYNLAKKYYEYYGDLKIPRSFITIDGIHKVEKDIEESYNLGLWISRLRLIKDSLTKKQIEDLESIGIVWNINKNRWNTMYNLAQKYYEYYGNLEISKNFITIDGIHKVEKDTEGSYNLGLWIRKLRTNRNNLTKKQIDDLNSIGMVWNFHGNKWNTMYNLAKNYYENYGNLEVPQSFFTIDGINLVDSKTKGSINLGQWISNLRTNKSNLSEERIKALKTIGMVWNINDQKWNTMYNLAKNYYEYYGNLEVPQSFVTIDGIHKVEKGTKGSYNLGQWMANLRSHKFNLNEERIKALETIKMTWNFNETRWNKMYNLTQKYYEYYGNLEISSSFVTIDGIHKVEKGTKGSYNLGQWISNLRVRSDSLTKEQLKALDAIGMIWNYKETRWNIMYNLAQNYYEYYGNLGISPSFVTTDGIHKVKKDTKGSYNLGIWISNLRVRCNNLTEEQIKALDDIGMIWNINENNKQVQECCKLFNINYEMNEEFLSTISIKKLEYIISYLQANNIPLVLENGIINLEGLEYLNKSRK